MDARDRYPHHRRGRERGSVVITVAFALVASFAFSVVVADIGLIWLTRIQLQNAADAGALAGAHALIRGTQGDAEAAAMALTAANTAWQDGLQPVLIQSGDVTFPTPTRCRVETHRTQATGDPLRTFFVRVLDPAAGLEANVTAAAEAEFYQVCASDCLKPWSVPDRWNDVNQNGEYDYAEPYTDVNQNGEWDAGEPFEDDNNNGQFDDTEPYDPQGTGYLAELDVGMPIILKIGSPRDTITPGFFFAVDFPPLNSPDGSPVTGANQYRWNIANCSPELISIGDWLQVEPGNMRGPTKQGVNSLLGEDPGAYWSNATQTVEGSAYGTSPRVIKMALFDPLETPPSGRNHVVISKLGAFFLESIDNQGNVTGRFMDLATFGQPCDPNDPAMLFGLSLSQ